MRNNFIYAIFASCFLLPTGCKKEIKPIDRTEATIMYNEICMLTKEFTDSLHAASDSATMSGYIKSYEDKLVKINFKHSPDTDLLMTQGQQDTVWMLTKRFLNIKQEKLRNLKPNVQDSIKIDSIIAAK